MEVPKSQLASLSDAQQRALLARLLAEKSQTSSPFPMSFGQQGLWHAYRRDPQSTAFNVFLPTRIRGPLCPEALKQSIHLVAQRHSALRTTFSDANNQLTQLVSQSLEPEFAVRDMSGASDDQILKEVDREVRRPFGLEQGPLLRVIVLRIASHDWIVVAITHHIIVDFWSLIVILSELRAIYPQIAAGRRPVLAHAFDNYRDFVNQQQLLLRSDEGKRLSEYWQHTLQGTSTVLDLPTDFQRPSAFTQRAGSTAIHIRPGVSPRIAQLSSAVRATPFAIVHAALQVLLQRYSRQTSFFVGSPFSGRSHHQFEQTVGFFINMLPVKASVDPEQTFADLVRQTSTRLLETLDHEALPVAEIVQQAAIPRDPSRSPLFQVSCTFERAQKREELGRAGFLFPGQTKVFDFAGMRQESFYVPHPTCHYDLEFVFEHSDEGLSAMLIYCCDLFSHSAMQQMAVNLSGLLESLLHQPGLPLVNVPWSRAEILEKNTTCVSARLPKSSPIKVDSFLHYRGPTVDDLIRQAALTTPNQPALQWAHQSVSYRQLLQVAEKLSHRLVRGGFVKDRLVPVVCRQGPHAFAAMLAVHLAGGAAVPIDRNQPSIALDRLLHDAQTHTILTDGADNQPTTGFPVECLPVSFDTPPSSSVDHFDGSTSHCDPLTSAGNQSLEAIRSLRDATALAYMIYTSGSTGEPKGVMVEHRSICNTLQWRKRSLPLTNRDKVLMLLSHQFDAAIGIGWSTLAQGASLVWPDAMAKRDPTLLIEEIRRNEITILPIVPSFLRILAQHPSFALCTSLQSIWVGGEPLPPELPLLIRDRLEVRIWNLYGPTEAAVEATAADVTQHAPTMNMTIGRPIDGTEVMIIDSCGRPVPSCVPGEIAIAGRGLARGYYKDADLTAQRFVPHPFQPDSRMYLTGDLGRQLPDGNIQFLGRLDHQVKLRGYRIELGEVESVLESHAQVNRAAVVLHKASSTAPKLIAYISPLTHELPRGLDSSVAQTTQGPAAQTNTIDTDSVAEYLTAKLAHYKRPSELIVLDSLPLTSSGKVDRKQLPSPQFHQDAAEEQALPRNGLEQWLSRQWCQELALESLGIYQNFFEAGGSSLQAALVTTQLSSDLGVHVPTALLFDLATIAQVARRLANLYPEVIRERFGQSALEFYSQADSHAAQTAVSRVHSLLAPLKPKGNRPPLFMVHPPGGIVVCYRELARHLPDDQPLWAIRSRGLHGHEAMPTTLPEMAEDYLQAIRSIQPKGPYILGGWSLGGLVAYEMARQLTQEGQPLDRLILLDSTIPEGAASCVPASEQVNVGLEYGIEMTLDQLGGLTAEQQLPMLYEHAARLGILTEQSAPEVVQQVLKDLQHLFGHHVRLSRAYRLEPIDVKLLLIRPQEVPFALDVTADRGWRHLVPDVRVRFVPGHHHSMVQAQHAQRLADVITQELML